MSQLKKVESVAIKKLLLEDDTGARVVITIPRGGVPLQEGGILRNISLGAVLTRDLINDFKKSRMKAAELQARGVEGLSEIAYGDSPEKLRPIDPVEQAQAALENVDVPQVFVPEGDEMKYCTCDTPMGTRRCLNCGLLVNRA